MAIIRVYGVWARVPFTRVRARRLAMGLWGAKMAKQGMGRYISVFRSWLSRFDSSDCGLALGFRCMEMRGMEHGT